MVNISVMSTACVDFINKTSSVGVICTGKTAVRCRPTGGGKNLYLQHVALSSKQSTKGLRFLTFTVTPNEEIIATQNRSFRLALLNTEECSHESKAKERSSLTEWLKADHDYGTLDTEDPLAVDESCTETCDRNEKVESISLKWKVNNQSGIQLSNRGDARKHGSDNDPDRGDKQKAVGDDTEHRKERLQVRVHGYYDNTQRVGHGRKKTVDGNGDDGSNSDDESHVNIIPGHYVENPYVNVKTYSKRGSQVENEDLEMISVSPEAIDEVCFPDIEVEAVSQCLQNDAEMTGSSSNIKDAEAPVTVKAKPPQVQEEERPPMRTKSGVPKVDRLINEKFLKLDEMKIQRILKLENSGAVLHAYRCKQGNCIQLEGNSCVLIKLLVHHLRKHQEVQKCHQCQFIDALLSLHSVNCGFEDCHIPFCLEAK